MNEEAMQSGIEKLREDLENRDREIAVLQAVENYLASRDDEKDPTEYREQDEYGFICDLAILLCPLHPALVRWLPDGDKMRDVLSKYLRDKLDIQGEYKQDDYTQEKCLENLKALHSEKKLQYDDNKRKLKELTDAED